MSQAEKAALWAELKSAGVKFERHYREYTTETLREAVATLRERTRHTTAALQQAQQVTADEPARLLVNPPKREPSITLPETAVNPAPAPPDQLAGLRQNTRDDDEPIRVDENGLVWYQDEVKKPAYPKPRARRVLKYTDPGTKKQTVKNGEYTETFEVAGDEQRISEVKVTLPTYQVGIYADPRYPFKIHVYNDQRGFDLDDVHAFYGAADLVPSDVARVYIANDLCYDIRTTIRAINSEYRERVLGQKGALQ